METIAPAPLKDRLLHVYEKHEQSLDIVFFLGGFLFDVITLGEVSDLFMILQQFAYLSVIGFVLYMDLLRAGNPGILPFSPRLERIWGYRALAVHFCLGSMMSLYSLFFLMSSSFLSSGIFVVLLFAVMVANELKFVREQGVDIKVGLFVICVFCFASLMFPLILGWVGLVPFLLAFASTLGLVGLLFQRLRARGGAAEVLKRRLLFPGLGISGVFLLLYLFGLIPPVPLSASKLGIYHQIDRPQEAVAMYRVRPWWNFWEPESAYFAGVSNVGTEGLKSVPLNDKYLLHHERPWWKFWQNGDQDFVARPGDKIFFLAAISSPGRIDDTVFVRWYFHDAKRGWTSSDRIPLHITGGRKGGFRGFAMKANYDYGDGSWCASVETSDGREIGRMYFTVTKGAENMERVFSAEAY